MKFIGAFAAAGMTAAALAQGPAQNPLPLPRDLTAAAIEARQAPLPAELPAPTAQIPAVQLEQNNAVAPGEAFRSIRVENADLRELLSYLVQSFGLNLAMAPDLNGKVTVNLQDATFSDALESILTPLDLHYRVDGKLLRVFKPQMESRTFTFNYVDIQRNVSRSLSASATAGFSGGGLAGTGGSSVSGGSATSISGTQSTDVMKDIDEGIKLLKSERGTVVLNKMNGIVFATDFPRNLDGMKIFLETMQNVVNRQVVIEAKLIEVQLNQQSQMGVNWSAVFGNTLTFGAGLGQQSVVQVGLSYKNFNAIMSALETQGKVSVRSAPSLITMNNQPAVIRVGTQDVFFITTTQLDSRTGAVLQSSTVPATVNEGVVLDVTPNISDDGVIMMNIHPTVTQRTGQVVSPQGNTAPITSVQETDTNVRIRDGEMVAIAGLISDRITKDQTKVPILSSLPGIGKAFRKTSDENHRADLAILLSARILNLSTIVDYSKARAEELDKAEHAKLPEKVLLKK